MPAGRRRGPQSNQRTLADALIEAGLDPDRANRLQQMRHEVVQVHPRTSFREPRRPRPELMFLLSGVISKYKVAGSGARKSSLCVFPESLFSRASDLLHTVCRLS